ncbi:MAG: Na-translocating system protein MpsC family protein [Clostridia bacterium]|nr:Na-translocating system protein MpsC family protein [Clostridia bacterium]
MTKQIKQIEANIKNGITKIYKGSIGRGPDDIRVHLWDNVLTCELVGALTFLEEFLYNTSEGGKIVQQIRSYFLSFGGDPMKQWLEKEFGNKVKGRTYWIDNEKNIVYTFFIFENSII